jgi:internalin A
MTDIDVLRQLEGSLGIQFVRLDSLYDASGQYLSGKAYTCADETITGLAIINKKLTALPAEIFKLTNLKTLVIIGNQLCDLPGELGRFADLETLDISCNQLEALPDNLSGLVNLRKLNIGYNQLKSLPLNIDKLILLEDLNVTTNRLAGLPESFGKLTKLKRLNIKSNQLDELPECLASLVDLELLNISYSRLSRLPGFLGKLIRLENLNISSNQLTVLPDELCNLTSLQLLNAGKNRLCSMGESIGELRNSRTLLFDSNQLTSLPSSIGRLIKLQTLDISSNLITRLDESIGELSSLRTLFANSNRLSCLPETINQLQSLQTLDINSNAVERLPESMDRLVHLKSLYLGANLLESLPERIGSLKCLKTLDISGNKFSALPSWFLCLELPIVAKEFLSDNEINLYGNPLTSPPVEIVKEGNPAIESYFNQLAYQGKDYICEAKIMIVGEPGAGKTSLMNKLFDRNFKVPDNGQKSTTGIEIRRNWEFKFDNDIDFKAHIWDFGGQQIQYALHQFFLTSDCLYVLMAEKRKENANLDYWLNMIDILGKDSPVIVLFNEINSDSAAPFIFDEKKYRELFPRLDLVRMDVDLAKIDDGRFDSLVAALHEKLGNLELIGHAVPADWVKIRRELEKKKDEKYIAITEYMDICNRYRIHKEEDQFIILKYFHLLGIVLYFSEDPNLCDTLFLDPNWTTDGIYAVLADKTMEESNGIFDKDFVDKLWSKKGYSFEERTRLLRLMLKNNFELCYNLSGSADKYIIPLLLPREKPEYSWDDRDNLVFRFQYPFMPRGIVSRLIVKLHEWIDNNLVWNYGAVFRRKDVRAQVTERLSSREGIKIIEIKIAGNPFPGKEFLTIIRAEINKIQTNSFPDLPYSEMIPCHCRQCSAREEPYFFDYKVLEDFWKTDHREIQCTTGKKMVKVADLLHYIFTDAEITRKMKKGYTDEAQITRINREVDELKADNRFGMEPGGHIMVFVEEEEFFPVFIDQLSQFGFEVTPVYCHENPLQLIRDCKPDIIISGINLTGLDGIDLLNMVKGDTALRPIPVIILTTADDEEKEMEATMSGAVYYFNKPFSFKDILLKIYSIIKNNNIVKEFWLASFENKIKDFFRQEKLTPLERFFRENDFTDSQKKIIQFIVNTNLINKQIADKLAIEENALSQRLKRIYERCGVQSRAELLRKVYTN